MTVSILRTADDWWVQTPTGAARITTAAATTANCWPIAPPSRPPPHSDDTVPVDSLELVSPITVPCRVVAQWPTTPAMSKMPGMDPATVPLAFFRKSSGSINGPTRRHRQARPRPVPRLRGRDRSGLRQDAAGRLPHHRRHPGRLRRGLVVTNDVSARDVQLTKTQFYESKSYPTFTPVGPFWCCWTRRTQALRRLAATVEGQRRDPSGLLVDGDIIYWPVRALQALSRFQRLDAGDLVLTGTPAGTAMTAPPKPIPDHRVATAGPAEVEGVLQEQAENAKYLRDGDVVRPRWRPMTGRSTLAPSERCQVRMSDSAHFSR